VRDAAAPWPGSGAGFVRRRCPWAETDPLLREHHDRERGRFPADERSLFEALSMDVLKGGLSWRDVLARRSQLRLLFDGFDPERVATFGEERVGAICRDLQLPHHRGRIRAVTQNARRLLALRSEVGTGPDDADGFGRWLRATPPDRLPAELLHRFRLGGLGVARSFVEAIGLVALGHAPDCWRARAVVFDLDGVILDSELWWRELRSSYVAARGGKWSDDDQAAIMGMSSPEWSAEMVRRHDPGGDARVVEDAIVSGMVRLYQERDAPLIGDAAAVVRSVAARHPVGLATSAHPLVLDAAIRSAGLVDVFEARVSSDEVAAGKPSPHVYLEAARRLALRPASCLAVEDSLNGVLAARAAGMRVVLVPNGAIPPAAGARDAATAVADSLADVDPDAVMDAHEPGAMR